MSLPPPARYPRAHARPLPAIPLALAALLALVPHAQGCGGAGKPAQTAAELRETDPIRLLDPESWGVLRVDLARLRASSHYPALVALAEALDAAGEDEAPAEDSAGPDLPETDELQALLEQTDHMLVGMATPAATVDRPEDDDAEPDITVVAVGDASSDDLAALMLESGAQGEPFDPKVPDEPQTVAYANDQGFLVHDGSRIALGGSLAGGPAALDRWRDPGPSPFESSPTLSALATEVGFERGVAVLVLQRPERLPDEDDAPEWATDLVHGASVIDLTDRFDWRIVLRYDDPAVAASLAEDLRDAIARARGNPFVNMFGLADALDAAVVERTEGTLRASVSLDPVATGRIVQTLGGFAAFLSQGFGGS